MSFCNADAFDGSKDVFSYISISIAYVKFDFCSFSNNVFCSASVEFANGYCHLCLGSNFARYNGLQTQNCCTCHNNGVNTVLRHTAVSTSAVEAYKHTVASSEDLTRTIAYFTCAVLHEMLTEYYIRFRKASSQTVFNHFVGAFTGFFRRLKHNHQSTLP